MNYKPLFYSLMLSSITSAGISATSLPVNPKQPFIAHEFNLSNKKSYSDAAKRNLHRLQLAQLKHWTKLKGSLSELKLNDDVKTKLMTQLDFSIATLNLSIKKGKEETRINFLELQLKDAFDLVESIRASAIETIRCLSRMEELASQATQGTASTDALKAMDEEFQFNKSIIKNNLQDTQLIHGHKTVTGGDISIQIGEDNNELSTMLIKIPAFDPESLAISDLSIETKAKAEHALKALGNSFETVIEVFSTIDSLGTNDAMTMLDNIPFVLKQEGQLLSAFAHTISISRNGFFSDEDRISLDRYLEELKKLGVKLQTYVSLNGLKMLGGGTIHIQIGRLASPETTLDIQIPVTDLKKSGLDDLHVLTLEEANLAWDALVNYRRYFVYSNH